MPKCECQIGISGLDVRRRYFSVFFCKRNSVSNTISKLSATMVWPFYQLYPLNFQDITANSKSECALLRLFKKYNLNVSECVCAVWLSIFVSQMCYFGELNACATLRHKANTTEFYLVSYLTVTEVFSIITV